jgi:nucleotide-binding universal stress UspA family protein
MGAMYIVMGAFGHGRVAEAIFGGVTRSMLLKSDLPLLLAN